MKTVLILAALLATATTSNAFAVAKPDIVCIEESGFEYKFYHRFGEIHIKDDKGQELDHLDGLSVRHLVLESNPPQDQYSYVDEDGHTLAVITFRAGAKTGQGEMVDNDQTMNCNR